MDRPDTQPSFAGFDWLGLRQMHVRHPDGHVFRIGRGIGEAEPAHDH